METHAHQLIGLPLLKTGRVTIVGAGVNPLNFIAAADVARYVMLQTTDQTLDPTDLQREFPFDMIRVDDFIRRDVESFEAPRST